MSGYLWWEKRLWAQADGAGTPSWTGQYAGSQSKRGASMPESQGGRCDPGGDSLTDKPIPNPHPGLETGKLQDQVLASLC